MPTLRSHSGRARCSKPQHPRLEARNPKLEPRNSSLRFRIPNHQDTYERFDVKINFTFRIRRSILASKDLTDMLSPASRDPASQSLSVGPVLVFDLGTFPISQDTKVNPLISVFLGALGVLVVNS